MKVKFHNPEYPDDIEFDFGGLAVINGKTVTFTKEELELYEVRNGVALKDRLLVNPFATVDGTRGEVTYLHPVEEIAVEEKKEGDN